MMGKRKLPIENELSNSEEKPTTPLIKQQKQETSPTSSSTTSQRKRKGLCVNGRVEVEEYIYIAPSKWIETELQPRVDRGEFCCLIAPSQSGKTSRITNSFIPMI